LNRHENKGADVARGPGFFEMTDSDLTPLMRQYREVKRALCNPFAAIKSQQFFLATLK